MKFIKFADKRGQTRFRIVADNNKTIASSEGYHNESDAVSTIELIKREAAGAEIVTK